MALTPRFEPIRTAAEVREQLMSSQRRTGFFFGAGTSIAAGLPSLVQLTSDVAAKLGASEKKTWDSLIGLLPKDANLEQILNRVRLLRELLNDDAKRNADGVSGEAVAQLDAAICNAIYWRLASAAGLDLKHHSAVCSWLRQVQWSYPVELFTTNYDLVFESSFEDLAIPSFDGFVGSVRPFFALQCVESDGNKNTISDYPPTSWIRLWKLHGSIGWRLETDATTNKSRIVRLNSTPPDPGTELLIYPSREKYTDSRKLPYLAYLDRLSKFLSSGASFLVICGYSFGDDHLNSVIVQGLRSNNRAAVAAFMFEPVGDALLRLAITHRNLAVYGPDSACIGGIVGGWMPPAQKRQATEEWPYWDETKNQFCLGGFAPFSRFLQLMVPQSMASISSVASGATP